jgi:hypothetical protein
MRLRRTLAPQRVLALQPSPCLSRRERRMVSVRTAVLRECILLSLRERVRAGASMLVMLRRCGTAA